MSITTSASISAAKTTLLANSLLRPLVANNILAQFLKSDTEFLSNTGSFSRGATINIPVVPTPVTNIVTATGGAVTFVKQTLTQVALVLDFIASSPFSLNLADLALANIDPSNAQIMATAENHGAVIEKTLFLNTFNDTAIDLNSIGTVGQACNYKLLRTIWANFKKAKVPDSQEKILIVSPDQYSEMLDDPRIARTVATNGTGLSLSEGILDKTLNIRIYPSINLPTSTELTNLTGTGTNQVGFAFTTDSVAVAVRELSTAGDGLGVSQKIARSNEYNLATRVTVGYNQNVIGGDIQNHMETLFGSKIYRPTTVFPVFGGIA
jgi:hypothetical protein